MIVRRLSRSLLPASRSIFSNSSNNDLTSVIAEFNKEMEDVFGEAPPSSLAGSGYNPSTTEDSQVISPKSTQNETRFSHIGRGEDPKSTQNETRLSHIGNKGEAQMVDVSSKQASKRVAVAKCKVLLGKKAFNLVSANQMVKGDVLSVAKIAGISGAKQTSNLIPLCHNISLTHVRVDLTLNQFDFSVDIEGEASCTGKTGVEMEALTAVTVAGLTVYDMCKAACKDIRITDVRLERKEGGKSGDWSREK